MKNPLNALPDGETHDATEQEAKLPVVEYPVSEDPLLYTLPSLHYRQSERVGRQGFSNGLLRIPYDIYAEYVTAYEENKRLALVIGRKENAAQLKEDQRRQMLESRDHLHATVIEQQQENDRQLKLRDRYAETIRQLGERAREIRQRFRERPPAYGWIGTLLFIAAGVIFIKTDISILNTIAGTALDMGREEAYTFALGVAFLAIVIKPLVDRVFEKPYQAGRTVWMHGLLVVIGISTIAALGIMGAYRNDAFLASKLESSLEAEKNRLQEEVLRGQRADDDPAIAANQRELAEVSALYDSESLRWIFILSSVLFAIAGAICFSIAVPALRRHANRLVEQGGLAWRRRRYQNLWDQADRAWRQAENAWKIAEQKLPLLPDLSTLEAECRELVRDIQEMRREQHRAHTQAVLAVYRNSYQYGERYVPSEAELARFESQLAEQFGRQPHDYRLNRKFSGNNLFNSQYLHEYIRQNIHKDGTPPDGWKDIPYSSNGKHSRQEGSIDRDILATDQ